MILLRLSVIVYMLANSIVATILESQNGYLRRKPAMESILNPNYTLYHKSDVLLKQLDNLVARHPTLMKMDIERSETNGYSCEMAIVTFEPGGTSVDAESKLRILLDFGQHGREMVTSEVALRLLQILGGEHHEDIAVNNPIMKKIFSKLVIKVVPMENANGRKIVENGDLCERKNGRGVDTNRNWGVSWGNREKDYDPNEENPGTEPFSEPEVRILQQIAKSFRPHLWVNVHSGMQALFMPYDHKRAIPDDAGGEIMNYLLNNLNRLHCNNSCVVGSGGGSVGYVAHGTATDYMYDSLGVPIALTFEIYGDSEAEDADCFRMFNPTTSVVLEKVVSNWSSLLLALILDLPNALKSMPNSQKWDNVFAGLDEQGFSRSYSFTGRKGRLFWHEPFKQDWHINSSGNQERTLPMLNVLCILVAFSWLVYKVLRCRRIWRVSR